MKYQTYEELPSLLKTEDGEIILIRGYLVQAASKAIGIEQTRMAEKLLNAALEEAIDLKGEPWVKEWIYNANRHLNGPEGKESECPA